MNDDKKKKVMSIIKDAIDSSEMDQAKTPKRKRSSAPKKTVGMSIVGNGNIQVGGNVTHNFYGDKKENITVTPPVGSIGADALLRDRIETLIGELGMRRKERLGNNAFAVMMNNFKRDFKIQKNKKWTCIWLWPESRAEEIVRYFQDKLGNTIKGRLEKAASKPGYQHSRRQLFAKERKILDDLGLDSDNHVIRDCMMRYFGVSSRREMTDEQLASWVAYLDQEAEKSINSKG